MGDAYFADSFYWIAMTHPKDAFHDRVAAWQLSQPQARLVTTEEVLTEVLTWFAGKGSVWRRVAADVARSALRNPYVRVVPQTSADFLSALSFYESRLDKEYGLTDCRSMVAMKSLGLLEVLTNDHHFEQEGFTVLFPSPPS